MTSYQDKLEVLGPWSLSTSRAFWEGFTPAALPAQPAQPARGSEQLRTVFRVEADRSRAEATVSRHGDTARITVAGDGDLDVPDLTVRAPRLPDEVMHVWLAPEAVPPSKIVAWGATTSWVTAETISPRGWEGSA